MSARWPRARPAPTSHAHVWEPGSDDTLLLLHGTGGSGALDFVDHARHFSPDATHLSLDTLHEVMKSLLVNREGLRYALVVHAGFKLRHAEVTGYLVIVLSVASLDRLIRAVESWEHREGHA